MMRVTTYSVKGAILRYRLAQHKWPKAAAEIRPYIKGQAYSETAFIERVQVSADNLHAEYRVRVSNGAKQETLRAILTASG